VLTVIHEGVLTPQNSTLTFYARKGVVLSPSLIIILLSLRVRYSPYKVQNLIIANYCVKYSTLSLIWIGRFKATESKAVGFDPLLKAYGFGLRFPHLNCFCKQNIYTCILLFFVVNNDYLTILITVINDFNLFCPIHFLMLK